jgi:hypothetical protein
MKFLLLIFLISPNIFAVSLRDIEWKEVINEDGITIYKPKKFEHDSGVVPLRFKAIIHHNISRVLTVLSDNKRKLEWFPDLEDLKLIDKKSVSDQVIYYRYYAPWPFKDRDFLVKQTGNYNAKELKISVDIKSIDHKKDPADGSTVRAITFDGYSIIQAHKKNKTTVEMAFLNDFKGNIPTWIINIVQKKWPHKFMKSLRKQLNKTDIVIAPEFKDTMKK